VLIIRDHQRYAHPAAGPSVLAPAARWVDTAEGSGTGASALPAWQYE
jgi:hypothetical protein